VVIATASYPSPPVNVEGLFGAHHRSILILIEGIGMDQAASRSRCPASMQIATGGGDVVVTEGRSDLR